MSGRDTRLVTITLDEGARRVACSCSCPFAADFGACHHMWAVLLAADARDALPPSATDATPFTPPMSIHEPAWARPSGRRQMAADFRQHARETMDWKRQAEMLRARFRGDPVPPTPATWPSDGQLFYLVDLDRTVECGELSLRVVARRSDASGKEPGYFRLTSAVWRQCPDPDDRLIAELLLGSHETAEEPAFTIPVSSFELTLRRIVRTGRCRFRSRGFPHLNGAPVTLDAGGAWRLRLCIRSDETGAAWRVFPMLYRDGQELALQDPLLIAAGGAAIVQDRLTIVDTGRHRPMIESLRLHAPIVAPRDRLAELASTLYGLPDAPEIVLPPEHRLQIVRRKPQVRVTIGTSSPTWPYRGDSRVELSFVYGHSVVAYGEALRRTVRAEDARIIARDAAFERAAGERLLALGAGVSTAEWDAEWPRLVVSARHRPTLIDSLEAEGWQVIVEGDHHAMRRSARRRSAGTSASESRPADL